VLDGYPMKSAPGERFNYCNGGYVVLALIAERASGIAYHDLVDERVCRPAGMADTAFLRSDSLPGRAARGYLGVDGLRTNVLHLPVLGSGDGGIYSTAADLSAFWDSLFAGRIVAPDLVAEMLRPRSDVPEASKRYGLGFHRHATGDGVWLEGYDAGVSFASLHEPSREVTRTVIANWSDGAWPLVKLTFMSSMPWTIQAATGPLHCDVLLGPEPATTAIARTTSPRRQPTAFVIRPP